MGTTLAVFLAAETLLNVPAKVYFHVLVPADTEATVDPEQHGFELRGAADTRLFSVQ